MYAASIFWKDIERTIAGTLRGAVGSLCTDISWALMLPHFLARPREKGAMLILSVFQEPFEFSIYKY